MNKSIRHILIFWLFVLVSIPGYTQTSGSKTAAAEKQPVSSDDMEAYQKQAAQMVSFMEFAFNTIGSSKTEYKEKDIIINQSYLKFFKDSKVQVEDDLAEQRDVVTNKDIQAYLKDIDFFFKDVKFKFTIEEISQEMSESGDVFFKVKTSRNLNGITLDGNVVNNNQPRFIEINLDEANRALKIASIYTTKGGEEQELMSWWNNLDTGWRNFLADNVVVADSIPLKDVLSFGADYLMKANGLIHPEDSTLAADTVKVPGSVMFAEIRRILRTEQIDLSGIKDIFGLEPLSAFPSLKRLNITGAKVSELDPVRNLSKLETLIASGSMISSLAPLNYTTSIRYLDISETFVNDLSPVGNFHQLEFLNISGIPADNPEPLSNLEMLHEFRMNNVSFRSLDFLKNLVSLEALEMSGTAFADMKAVSNLKNLKRIKLERTYITNISPLALLADLQYVYMDNSPVGDLMPLVNIPSLKIVYCDKTMVNKTAVLAFMKQKPGVKVIFESEELIAWWEKLPSEWKEVFGKLVELSPIPEKEQLHEVIYQKKIDLTGIAGIQDFVPLRKLSSLEVLLAQGTGVREVMPLKDLVNLQVLNLQSTKIVDISPLTSLSGLRELNLSGTLVADISPVGGLRDLQMLAIDNCPVLSLSPVLNLKRLEILYADGVSAVAGVIEQIRDSIPEALIVYQTEALTTWWNSLTNGWKAVFNQLEAVSAEPDRVQLHRLSSLRKINLSESRDITDIGPLRMLIWLESLDISRLPVTGIMPLSSHKRIREFNCSNTPVEDLKPLALNVGLQSLYCSNTQINDLDVLEKFTDLKVLDISGTQVTRLNALSSCRKLRQLDCYNTRISNIKALDDLVELTTLRIYNTRVSSRNIEKFKVANPNVEVVFY